MMEKILEELQTQYESEMDYARSTNHNEVAIGVESGGEKKVYIEKDFFGCGSTWFTFPKKDWREAKKLGFNKGYLEWTFGNKYENGGYGLAQKARFNALDTVALRHPEAEWLEKVGVGSWID